MGSLFGRLMVGCVFACFLIWNLHAGTGLSNAQLLSSTSAIKQPLPPWPESVLKRWDFDDAFRPVALRVDALADALLAVSYSGYALDRTSHPRSFASAFLSDPSPVVLPMVDATGCTNAFASRGTLRFWFKPESNAEPGLRSAGLDTVDDLSNASVASESVELLEMQSDLSPANRMTVHYPRLLELASLDASDNASVVWSLYFNPQRTEILLSKAGLHRPEDCLSAPVCLTNDCWQLIALSWDVSGTRLYVNGKLAAQGSTLPEFNPATSALIVGSDWHGRQLAGGLFDDLTSLPGAVKPATLAQYFNGMLKATQAGSETPASAVRSSSSSQSTATLAVSTLSFGPPELDSGGGSNLAGDGPFQYSTVDYGTNLWLEIFPPTNDACVVVLHNTMANQAYDLLSKLALTNTQWVLEQSLLASSDTLTTTVPINLRTNFFLRARTTMDTDGDGLPDWYELEVTLTDPNNPDTGNTGTVDGYKDADNDGWTNIEEMNRGTRPHVWDTPAGPQVLFVGLDAAKQNGVLKWAPARGTPSSYRIIRRVNWHDDTFDLPAATTEWSDSQIYTNGDITVYLLMAVYPEGNSQIVSAWLASPQGLSPQAIVMGGNGNMYLAFPGETNQNITINLKWNDSQYNYYKTNFTVQITDGLSLLPGNILSSDRELGLNFGNGYDLNCQVISDSGLIGNNTQFKVRGMNYRVGNRRNRWLDGRQHLKQNLSFYLRAASSEAPFVSHVFVSNINPLWPNAGPDWRYNFVIGHSSLNASDEIYTEDYEQIGIWGVPRNPVGGIADLNNFWAFVDAPIEENYWLKNYCYNATNFYQDGNGDTVLITGAASGYIEYPEVNYNGFYIIDPMYDLAPSDYLSCVPGPVLDQTSSQLTFANPDFNAISGLVLERSDWSKRWNYISPVLNFWGLPVLGMRVVRTEWGQPTLTYDVNLHTPGPWIYEMIPRLISEYYYVNVADPVLQTIGYYFADMTDYMRPSSQNRPPVPFAPGFLSSTPSKMCFAGVGQPKLVAAWAKQRIVNGYTNKFAYLGQYFDGAYTTDANGVPTTNSAGILSEYGEFFPLQAGKVALVTKPDIDTGERGTGYVHVVKLQLDVNHDGVMDTSYAGPDNTSEGRPFVFWANNDYDRWLATTAAGGLLYSELEQDDLGPNDVAKGNLVPDFRYTTNGLSAIPCKRDLEDYARLWACGLSSAMSTMPSNYIAQLTLTGNGQIRMFYDNDLNSGTNYLFDDFTASNMVASSTTYYVGLLTSTNTIILKPNWGEHFIWCGANIGNACVNLQILDENHVLLAQTSAYFKIKDIKDMYERWTVGDNSINAPLKRPVPAVNDLPDTMQLPFQYGITENPDTSYVLHVHGYNMAEWEKDRYAETEYKRLYWQGYEGRFGAFRWPTTLQTATYNKAFDDSEFNAWKSAASLLNLLTNLTAIYDDNVFLTAHSHGNIVAGEALRLAKTNQVINTYIAMQAAVPAHSYDSTAPTRTLNSLGYNLDSGTPNRYAQYYTNGAPCYFHASEGARNYVNFFNTNDWALTTLWRFGQDMKWDVGYHFNGTNFTKGYIPPYLLLLFPADTHTIFSYCVEARCEAFGAQANVGGAFKVGSVCQQVQLNIPPYNFGPQHSEHSGQFRSDNMRRWQFWDAVLVQMGLK